MTPSNNPLDDLLDRLFPEEIPVKKVEGAWVPNFMSKAEAKAAIEAYVEEIIGEDEVTVGLGMNPAGHKVLARNQLRAEQRKRLKGGQDGSK